MAMEKSDVLIIGSGGAGLRTAIELHDNSADVLVVGKCERRDAHTIKATGGINAALGNMDPDDSWQLHAADTIKDGGGINDTEAVKILCKNAANAVKELAKWGVKFHKEKNGKITQRFFGAATFRRACFIGDETGKAILNTLVDQTLKRKIRFKSEIYIFSLLHKNGKVNGALGLDMRKGKIVIFNAKVVVLATGGHSRMFGRSSSRFWENNGDGIFLAQKCGATFMDMEMFQFHPTGMVYPSTTAGTLVTEAVRGEGGILTNNRGERFMERYDPERKELSARDVVARANYMEISKGRGTKHGGVWLDISHKPKKYILKRLPLMYKQFKAIGVDISKEKMEVGPTAHYSMGGIYVDHNTGKTDVSNLYAIGEVTSGVHGGNRLGGNSLVELIVFGRLTGKQIIKDLKKIKETPLDEKLVEKRISEFNDNLSTKGMDPIKAKKELQKYMWEHVGVVRNAKHMNSCFNKIKKLSNMKLKTGKSLKMNEKLIAALDLKNAIPTTEMIIKSALFRKESRAAHYRSDYPKERKIWQKNIICEWIGDRIKLKTKKVKPVPKDIRKYLKMDVKFKKERHMLE